MNFYFLEESQFQSNNKTTIIMRAVPREAKAIVYLGAVDN